MANEKLLPANLTLLLAYREAIPDPLLPSAAKLNDQFVFSTNEDGLVFNISCAVLDDYTLNQTESDTDDTRTVCDEGEVSNPTFKNFEASINSLRDESLTDAGLYNMVAELTRAPDRPFYIVRRIGVKQNVQFATGQEIDIFPVLTDFPQDGVEATTLVTHGARFIPDGAPYMRKVVVA